MMKAILKKSYEAMIRFLISLIRQLSFTEKNSIGALAIENFVNSLFLFSMKMISIYVFRKEVRFVTKLVEEKYDKLAGDYIAKFENMSLNPAWYYVEGEIRSIPKSQYYRWVIEEYLEILSSYTFSKVLEVGTGELTTILPIAQHYGTAVEYYGMDLSLNRVHLGYQYFKSKCPFPISVCKANAAQLPYREGSFDLVFTSFCLEHMPYDYKKAIDEMVRVSRSHIVLFEPLYEGALFSQKMNMLAKGYVRGILNYLDSLPQVKVESVFRLKTGMLFNRGSCVLIRLNKAGEWANGKFDYVCPVCKSELEDFQDSFFCGPCSKVFLKFGEIPLLDERYSFYLKKGSPALNLASKA